MQKKKGIIRVLIVDDEIFVRLGLKMSIDWKQYGYEIVGEASNGVEALALCESLKPHIILTDIKMPAMDGLEFIRYLNKKYPNIKAIILSNYNEFTYAQEAIALGAVNYILKVDIAPEELIKSLNKVRDKYFGHIDSSNLKSEEAESDINKYMLIKSFLTESLTEGQIEEWIKKYNIQIKKKNMLILIVKVDKYTSRQGNYYKNTLLFNSVLELIKDCLHSLCNGEIIPDSDGEIILIISLEKCRDAYQVEKDCQKIVKYILESIKKILSISASVGISNVHQSFKSLKKAFEEAKYALNMKFFEGHNSVFYYKDVLINNEMNKSFCGFRHSQIITAISEHDEKKLKEIINKSIHFFVSNKTPDQKVRLFFFRLIIEYADYVQVLGEDYIEILGRGENPIEKLLEIETIKGIKEYLCIITKRLLKYKIEYKAAHKNTIINKGINYVLANYDKQIGLTAVAKYLNVNAAYFCKLFKKVMGVNFIEYLTKVRMDKAKYYLANTDMKVYEVSVKVGYQNAEYFSRLFKKITGMSPKEYSENNLN